MNRTWAYAALAAAGVWGFYNYAPSPEEESYFKRLVEYYMIPSSVWEKRNNHHLIQSVDKQADTLLMSDAKRPDILRYTFPQ